MSNQESNNFLNIIILLFLAVVIAYPVSSFIKNRSDLSTAITPEQRDSFVSNEVFNQNAQNNLTTLDPGSRVGEGYKSVSYANDGHAIICVTINNVANLTKEEFYSVGYTPFSLLNTVRANIRTPQVLDVVFNDDIIVGAFFERESTKKILNNPQTLLNMISRNDKEVSDFINHPAFQEALSSKEVLNAIAGSQMVANILASPTGKFFLTNPDEIKRLINQNEDIRNLSKNENLRNLLLNFEGTKQAARIALN